MQIGDRMLQNPPKGMETSGNDMANNSRERSLEKERERVKNRISSKVKKRPNILIQSQNRNYSRKRVDQESLMVKPGGGMLSSALIAIRWRHRAFELLCQGRTGILHAENQNKNGGNNGRIPGGGKPEQPE
nr:hypothetical protein Iba_chr12aCG10300 [Ipomoea batatas]